MAIGHTAMLPCSPQQGQGAILAPLPETAENGGVGGVSHKGVSPTYCAIFIVCAVLLRHTCPGLASNCRQFPIFRKIAPANPIRIVRTMTQLIPNQTVSCRA